MTRDEADRRLSTSALTLNAYRNGGRASPENIPLMRDEMLLLEQIAKKHRDMAVEANALIRQWQQYLLLVKGGLH